MFHLQHNNRTKKGKSVGQGGNWRLKGIKTHLAWLFVMGTYLNSGHRVQTVKTRESHKNREFRDSQITLRTFMLLEAERLPFCTVRHWEKRELEEGQTTKHHEIILPLIQASTGKQTH
jgi:hypothetical protein